MVPNGFDVRAGSASACLGRWLARLSFFPGAGFVAATAVAVTVAAVTAIRYRVYCARMRGLCAVCVRRCADVCQFGAKV